MPRETGNRFNQSQAQGDLAHETAPDVDFDAEHDQKRAEQRSRMQLSSYASTSGLVAPSLAPLAKRPFEEGRAPVSEDPVPAPFDMPIPIGKCGPPPPPRDWSATRPILATPTEPLLGQPAYKPEYADDEHGMYKQAFNASWSEAQSDYNSLVLLHQGLKSKQNELVPFLGADANVGVGANKRNATHSFDGGHLKGNLSNVKPERVGPDLAKRVAAAKDKADKTDLMIETQKDGIANAIDRLQQANLEVENAVSDISLAKIEGQIAERNLDKEQVRRDLEDSKAKIKATVETAKAATAMLNILTDPTKVLANMVAAGSQTIVATGAVGEAVSVSRANAQLKHLDEQIGSLQTNKFELLGNKASNSLAKNLAEVQIKSREIRKAFRDLEIAKKDQALAYRELADIMASVGGVSGMTKLDQSQLAAAVEAVPKIASLIDQIEAMQGRIAVPAYTEASGIGAAMCSNTGAFTHAIGMLKGNQQYLAEQKAIWEARRASVKAAIDQALFVPGTEI